VSADSPLSVLTSIGEEETEGWVGAHVSVVFRIMTSQASSTRPVSLTVSCNSFGGANGDHEEPFVMPKRILAMSLSASVRFFTNVESVERLSRPSFTRPLAAPNRCHRTAWKRPAPGDATEPEPPPDAGGAGDGSIEAGTRAGRPGGAPSS